MESFNLDAIKCYVISEGAQGRVLSIDTGDCPWSLVFANGNGFTQSGRQERDSLSIRIAKLSINCGFIQPWAAEQQYPTAALNIISQ